MTQNSQPQLKPSLFSCIGARVDDTPYHVRPREGNPRSYHFKQREETRLRPLKNDGEGKLPPQGPGLATPTTGHAGRGPQATQSVYCHVPASHRTTAFSPHTVTQEWNNHAYGILATVSISGSPTGSDPKAMSVDEGPLDSKQFRKRSSIMSVDPSPLTGTYRKASSRMSVDPPSPYVDQSTQHRASSRMSVDVPSTRRSRGSSDRMLIDEIHYPAQNVQQQANVHCVASFNARPTVPPTTICSRNTSTHVPQERSLASGASPPTSFPIAISQQSLSHDSGSARGEAKLAWMPSSRPSFLQHARDKENQTTFPATPAPPRSGTSKPSPSPIPNSLAPPPGQSDSAPAAPAETFSPKHGTPASRKGSGSPTTKRETIHHQSSTYRSRVRARGSSSGDEASHKRHCVRQDSQRIALLFIDSCLACPSLQSPQSLSPIGEVWLPPMEQQLEMARKSELKARLRKFTAIIGEAVNEIKQAIVPYNTDHRKHKVARTHTNSEPSSGVPEYLRSTERRDSPKPTNAPRSQQRTSFDTGKDVGHITQMWTDLALCDSPTALRGDDEALQREVPHISLSLPRINEPPRSASRSPPVRSTADGGAVTQFSSDDEVEIYTGDAANLAAPTFRRHRTADAFNANGVAIPRLPNDNRVHRR
ncbi:hypothetical protein DFH29DRAFT_878869 [Suillus ampliporus]|nr:hypothetical protein DFH29DRAFT_878869 [Suillus ampliporus]